MTLSEVTNLIKALNDYKKLPEVEHIELNYKFEPLNTYPNDYHFTNQWALNNIGQPYPVSSGTETGTSNADINGPEAWDVTTGSTDIIIAVIDTGLDTNHEDLSNNIWINKGEIPGNLIDDDGNGYIDDSIGWDFSDDDNDPSDEHGHGTHCAGIIAAQGNNSVGITGINWQATIMGVKIFPNSYWSVCAEAIIYAADNGARVLSDSWGSSRSSQICQDAINYAYNVKGCVVVFSAGNSYTETPMYPAAGENIISVIATDSDDNKADFSSYGTTCDVSAPGVDILSLRADDTDMYGDGTHIVDEKYYICSGTSMACPYVAGLAGLILSKYPFLSNKDVQSMIEDSCDDLGVPGFDPEFAHGRINAAKAFQSYTNTGPIVYVDSTLDDDNIGGSIGNGDDVINPGETIELKVKLRNKGGITATNISTVLSTTDSYITLTDNSETFGDIPLYSSMECVEDFDFIVNVSCPTGHIINFDLTSTDIHSTVWTDKIQLSVGLYGPEMRYVTNIIDDDMFGNIPNNIANPDELIILEIKITNKGDMDANGVSANLSSEDPYVYVYSSSEDYEDIPVNQTGTEGFYMLIEPLAPDNHIVDLELIMRDSNLSTWTDNFSIVIKDATVSYIEMTTYEFDDDNIGQSIGNADTMINPNETIELSVNLYNKGTPSSNVTAILSTSDIYITMSNNTAYYSNIGHYEEKKGLNDFVFHVDPLTPSPHYAFFDLTVTDAQSNKWTNYLSCKILKPFVPSGAPILLVNRDWWEDYFDYYTNALNINGYTYDTWYSEDYGEVPLSVLTQYSILIWFTGDNYMDTFTEKDQDNVSQYLGNGGRMFLTGQDVGWDIGNTGFYNNYLYADYIKDDVNLYKLDGVNGDPISDGLVLDINGGDGADNQYYPSEIDPMIPAETIFTFNLTSYAVEKNQGYDTNRNAQNGANGISSSGTAGLKVDNGIFKVVYFAFGFEAIDNAADRSNVMRKVIEWLYATNVQVYLGPYYVATNGDDSNNGTFTNPFATIQKAVNMMGFSSTVATCYVATGIYNEEVEIKGNYNPGYMVITKQSNESPILQNSGNMNYGIYIDSTDNVIIKGLTICDYDSYGIQIYRDSTNNKIINNNIYNNDSYGIYIRYEDAQKNYIYGNNIWGSDQNYGIRISDGKNNIVESNLIHNNDSYGIYLYRAESNDIIRNTIYSNNNDGIRLYDSHGNYIFNNDIHGPGQADGIETAGSSSHNLISSNYLFFHSSDGIDISDGSNNYIIKNMIISNETYGINIHNDDSDNNLISSNIITGTNQNYGIYIRDAADNKLYRNLISYNQYSGIYLAGNSTGTKIINNTIFGSLTSDGIRCYDASSGEIYNNIILSNGNGSSDRGIENNGSGEINVNYNIIYGNVAGPINGPLLLGTNNIFTDPLIDTVSSFTITSLSSPAVDSALIIPGITDIFYGLSPDIGWKESSFSPLFDSGPYFVATNGSDSNIGSYTNPFATIQKAADVMSKGVSNSECYIFPGTYEEQIVIRSNKNTGYMKFKKLFIERPLLSGESFGAGSRGIFITNAAKVNISDFFIKGYAGGIDISGDSASNIISQNIIYSNKDCGIFINSQTADNIFILTNQIGGGEQNIGIAGKDCDNLNIFRNLIYNNNGHGIYLKGSSSNTKLINNTIFKSRTNSGILLEGTSGGEIYNNIILSNGDDINDYGIRNSGTGNIYAAYNNIYGNWGGPTNSISGWGNGNKLLNPLLDTATFFIASELSSSVDMATNIPSVSDSWEGLGPDIGWQESSFSFIVSYQGPFYVSTLGDDFNNGSYTNPFKTIQRAAYIMSTGVSNSICYISPGTYPESVKIEKNLNSGDMIITKLSNQMPILTGSDIRNNGIGIENAGNIIIRGLEIQNFNSRGIYITGTSSHISIIKNLISSNNSHGIELNTAGTMDISIYSNQILGNQNYGISIQNAENNIIRLNKIYYNQYGMYISGPSARDNIIVKNEIYSNSTCGIRIFSSASYNKILTNIIRGKNQDRGIHNSTGDNNIIKHNKIFNNQNDGIYFSGSARYNQIINNSIYSNIDSGINFDSSLANDNLIISNSIGGKNQRFGISIEDAKDNEIYRNIIWKNKNSGILIIGIASNIKIINNSIYGSKNQDGIIWNDTSGGIVYNNIILSNGDSVNSYGIQNKGNGTVIVDYNNIYGNFAGPTNNGPFICGSNNMFDDPLLETTSSFTLMSILSPALDSGIIIPGVSDNYIGVGPDMGAIESSLTDTFPPFFISISPYAGEKKVKTNVDISFYLSDNTLVKSNSIRIFIEGLTALTNGVFQTQFNGPASVFSNDGTGKGYTITIDPASSSTNN